MDQHRSDKPLSHWLTPISGGAIVTVALGIALGTVTGLMWWKTRPAPEPDSQVDPLWDERWESGWLPTAEQIVDIDACVFPVVDGVETEYRFDLPSSTKPLILDCLSRRWLPG